MAKQATPSIDPNRYRRLNMARLSDLPEELRKGKGFVCWRVEIRNDKPTKVPVNPHTGKKAKPNDPATGSTLAQAIAHFLAHPNELCGIGRVLVAEDGLTCIDFDGCLDEQGNLIPDHAAARWLPILCSYTEKSPGRRGVQVFVYATPDLDGKMGRNNKAAGVEIYRALHYLTLTGDVLPQFSNKVEYRQAEVEELYREVFGPNSHVAREQPAAEGPGNRDQGPPPVADDASPAGKPDLTDEEIIRRARRAKTGRQFQDLWRGAWEPHYPSQSEADLALCQMLWFQTGNKETVRRLVTLSVLGQRPKWRRKDYQHATIDLACREGSLAKSAGQQYGANTLPLIVGC
jgi:primase-polymerase (primpol)-like protein